MKTILYWTFVSFITVYPKTKADDVYLSPSTFTALEGGNGTISCIYEGQGALQGAVFKNNGSTVATIVLPNCTFNVAGNQRFKTDCEGNSIFKLKWINLTRADQGKLLTCMVYSGHGPIMSKNKVSVYVNVSVKGVVISSSDGNTTISACEQSVQNFNCSSSAARPAPSIEWIFQDNLSKINTLTIRGNETITADDDLFITTSILFFVANKTFNDNIVFCSSSNIPNEEVHSSAILLDIRYPPEEGPLVPNVINGNRDIYEIIEGREGKLSCTIPLGNPLAKLRWDCSNNAFIRKRSINLMSKDFVWKASRNDSKRCKCFAEHDCNNWTRSIIVERNVLYPPIVMHMDDIAIVEGSMLNTSCNVIVGIPKQTEFTWTRQKDIFSLQSKFLLIRNVSRDDASLYICTVQNNMAPTIGPVDKGTHSGHFNLAILYPPKIDYIHDQSIKEGSEILLECSFVQGNPSHTEFIWTINGEKQISENQILSIKNVSRNDSKVYTCTVFNTMVPTGLPAMQGISNGSFYLNVQYEATVLDFKVNGYFNITVNESETLILTCYVDSNPISKTDIMFQNGKQLVLSDSNNISLTLGPVDCLDTGTYFCNGRNKYNVDRSQRKVFVYVNCSPKAKTMVPIFENITTAQRAPVVLRFSAIAYPAPTSVVWQKLRGGTWIDVAPNEHITIYQTGLNYSLSINEVTETDFGQYRLVIVNAVGSFKQSFNIIYGVKPDSPKGFQVLTKLITPSSITVQWFPSFNGGKQQHFILNYSLSDEQRTKSEIIPDSNDTIINTTIKNLVSGTFYKLILYAENSVGRSDYTNTLYIQTAKLVILKEEDSGFSVISIAIGSGSSLVITLIGLVLGIWILKKRRAAKNGKSGRNNASYETTNDVTEYEEIRMSNQIDLRTLTEAKNKATKTDSAIHYERLDKKLKGKRQTKGINVAYENLEGPHESDTKATTNVELNSSEYINMTL